MERLLEGKTILIVGAGGLLGAKLTQSVLNQGAEVIAADIDMNALSTSLGNCGVDCASSKISLKQIDICSEDSVCAFFKESHIIDGAVNATYPRNKTYGAHFYDVSQESFNENLSLHLGSAFLFTRSCAKYFRNRLLPFSLVNVSSIYGVVAPKFQIYEGTSMTMPVEYAVIKSGLVHLSKYVVNYVNDSRFRINLVSPGGIEDGQPELFQQKYKQETLGQGMLRVDDVLGSIMFLLSDQAFFMNGQNLIVDDGFTL
jgi:NAD(P)-dependent dehydrogenase (short-subunit alcohol dehydrogenase family)